MFTLNFVVEDVEYKLRIHEYDDIIKSNPYHDYFFIETSGFINLLKYYKQFNYRLEKGIIKISTSVHNINQIIEHITYSMKKKPAAKGGLYNLRKILTNNEVIIIQNPISADAYFDMYGNDAIWLDVFFSAGYSKLVIHDNPVQNVLPKYVTVFNPQKLREM